MLHSASCAADTWRHPTRDMSAYFGQLTAWGYAASEVERTVIDEQVDLSVHEAPTTVV